MTCVRKVCGQLTLTGTSCRRTGAWCVEHGSDAIYCWPHAGDLARNRGAAELIHWVTGERRPVPQLAIAHVDETRPLPTGRPAIIRALNQVRTRRAFHRARYALICDLRTCIDRGGIAADVSLALARAKTRVGLNPSPPSLMGVRRR